MSKKTKAQLEQELEEARKQLQALTSESILEAIDRIAYEHDYKICGEAKQDFIETLGLTYKPNPKPYTAVIYVRDAPAVPEDAWPTLVQVGDQDLLEVISATIKDYYKDVPGVWATSVDLEDIY